MPQTSLKQPALHAACLLITACLIASCSPGDGPGDGRKVYRHGEDGAPASLDPAQAATIYSNMVVVNLFDTLYRYKYLARPYQVTPNLATGMPEVSDDGLTYTIRIHPGVRFADDPAFADGRGREITIDDVIYSMKRHFDPDERSQGAWLWQDRIRGLDAWGDNGADYNAAVEGLEAVDDYTLRIHLTEPYPQLVFTLTTGFSAVVPREAVEHYGREFAVRPVGSGPFRLVSFDSTRVVMDRNPHFDRGALDLAAEGFDPAVHGEFGLEALDGRTYPFIDRLEIHFIQETAARWNSFARGNEVHNVMVPNEQVDSVLASRDPIEFRADIRERYHGYHGPEAGLVYAGFNMADERFGHHPDAERDARNRALRCAMRDAFDWEARNRTFYFGLGQVFPGVIPPAVPEFDPDAPQDSVIRDIDGARERLAEAGWITDNLPELSYGMPTGVQQRQMFEQFRSQMQELGFGSDGIRLETFATFGDFSRAMKNRELDLFFLGWSLDYPDAENTLQLFYGPNETPGSNNFNYNNPEYDALYEQAATMLPGPERTRIYREMNRILIDDCVVISGLSRTRIHLWQKNARMVPDREILNGYFMRFVDVVDDET